MDDLRKYNAGNLHNGKISGFVKEVKEFLWAMYSAYIEQGLEPQKAFDEASHMAVHSVYQVMCDIVIIIFKQLTKLMNTLFAVKPYKDLTI